jgi:hypothetical protein
MADWQTLSSQSPYKTAMAIKQALQEGHSAEAITGLQELIDALSRSDKRALKSQLVRLMVHVIKWHTQPERRSLRWVASINDARDEIQDLQEETPSLSNEVIQSLWDKCFTIAKRDAEAEMNKTAAIGTLTWSAAFEDEYRLP